MPRKPRFTQAARLDLQAIRSWLLQPGSGEAARERLSRLERAIADIPTVPHAYPAGPVAGTRAMTSQGHRIVFRIVVSNDPPATRHVEILRIYGPGQSTP